MTMSYIEKYRTLYPVVSHKYRLLIFQIPKVGCSAIIRWVARLDGIHKSHEHFDYTQDRTRFNGIRHCAVYGNIHACAELMMRGIECIDDPSYLKCLFVRNPWSRLVSYYLANYGDENSGILGMYGPKIRASLKNPTEITFAEFVYHIVPHFDDVHFRPQRSSLETADGSLVTIDFLRRFERLPEAINELAQIRGITEPFTAMVNSNVNAYSDEEFHGKRICDIAHPHLPYPYPNYRFFYDTPLRDFVAQRYRVDIDLFRHTFDEG